MRFGVIALTIFMLCSPESARAQKHATSLEDFENFSDVEVATLRRALNVPESYPITLAPSKTAPPRDPLKIYIRSVFQDEVRRDVSKWVRSWNDGDAAKYGRLEVVLWDSQADVFLVQYEFPLPANVFLAALKARKIVPPKINPIFSYLIVPKPDGGGLEIIWRRFAWADKSDHDLLSSRLYDPLKSRLKERKEAKTP